MTTRLIDNSLIDIPPDRQRREHDEAAHQELIASMTAAHGLMHALVMRPGEGDRLNLVAGERRLRAFAEIWEFGGLVRYNDQIIPLGQVPYTLLSDLSPLEAEEAEWEENVRRKDLTWQELIDGEARLFALRAKRAALEGQPPPTLASIAVETRGNSNDASRDKVSKSLVLARNMHRPEVKGAATAADAFKALVRAEDWERNEAMGKAMGPTLSSKHTLVRGDSLSWMAAQPAAQFDVILTDPIYGMGADEFGDSGKGGDGVGEHFYADTYELWCEHMKVFMPESFRLTKPDAHLYAFCDLDRFYEMREWARVVGWKPFRTPLIWFKPSAFRAPWPEQGPQRKYECILYAVKGSLKTTTLRGDVIQCPPDTNLGHQAQKPVALYTDLLARSARPGMKVLDPFCGSGPIFPAANSLSVIATGVEQDQAAYGIAVGRIQSLKEKA